MNQQQAIRHVQLLTEVARRDWQTKHGTPIPEMGTTDRHRQINELLRSTLLMTTLKSGCSAKDADMAVLSAIWLVANMIESGAMDTSGEMVCQ